jgi:hypothetical protein
MWRFTRDLFIPQGFIFFLTIGGRVVNTLCFALTNKSNRGTKIYLMWIVLWKCTLNFVNQPPWCHSSFCILKPFKQSLKLNLTPCCQVSLPYIMGFDNEVNHQKIKSHAHMHHVVIITMWTLCYSILSHATLILFHHALNDMLTLLKSSISRVLWLPQVWYSGV